MNRTLIYSILLFLSLLMQPTFVYAVDPVYSGGRAAIRGYDTVAYFTQGKPVKGSKQFTTEYKGAKWRFSSEENLNLFLADPQKYSPQYGGYCAYAVANNTTASTKPHLFTIYEGKLYLNFNKEVQRRFRNNIDEDIEDANKNWPELLKR